MPQVEFGSLYKFVASVGLGLMIASVALPWILLQSTEVLLISQATIDGLPPSAGEAIHRRQDFIVWAQENLPLPFGALLAIGGSCLLIWALWMWVPSQRRTNANEEIALQRSQVEFEKLSRDEIDQKLQDEVAESVSVPADGPVEPPLNDVSESERSRAAPVSGGEASHEESSAQTPPSSPAVVAGGVGEGIGGNPSEQSRRLIAHLRAVEDRVATLFEDAFGAGFEIVREVKITSGAAKDRVLDVLLDPRSKSNAQLGVEITRLGSQVLGDRLSTLMTRTAIATQDLASGTVFTGERGRPPKARASGVLVFVLDAATVMANASRMERNVPAINSALKRPVGVVVIAAERLEQIRAIDLREVVSSVWANPNRVGRLE